MSAFSPIMMSGAENVPRSETVRWVNEPINWYTSISEELIFAVMKRSCIFVLIH